MNKIMFKEPTVREFVKMVYADKDSVYTKLDWNFIYDYLRSTPDEIQFIEFVIVENPTKMYNCDTTVVMEDMKTIRLSRIKNNKYSFGVIDNWRVIY